MKIIYYNLQAQNHYILYVTPRKSKKKVFRKNINGEKLIINTLSGQVHFQI